MVGNRVIGKRICAGSDQTSIGSHSGERARLASGGDDDVLGLHSLRILVRLNLQLSGADETGRAGEPGDLVLLEKRVNAAGEGRDDLGLALHHDREVYLHAGDVYPVS